MADEKLGKFAKAGFAKTMAGPKSDRGLLSPTSGFDAEKRRKPPGRKPGVPNKVHKNFKECAWEAFCEGGGKEWLISMMDGTASDRAAVLGFYGRLIPLQLMGEVKKDININISWGAGRSIGKTITANTESAVKSITEQEISDAEFTETDGRQQIDNKNGDNNDANEW